MSDALTPPTVEPPASFQLGVLLERVSGVVAGIGRLERTQQETAELIKSVNKEHNALAIQHTELETKSDGVVAALTTLTAAVEELKQTRWKMQG